MHYKRQTLALACLFLVAGASLATASPAWALFNKRLSKGLQAQEAASHNEIQSQLQSQANLQVNLQAPVTLAPLQASVGHRHSRQSAAQLSEAFSRQVWIDHRTRLLGGLEMDHRPAAMKWVFALSSKEVVGPYVKLHLNNVQGIDEASSPTIIKLNGKRVSVLSNNGTDLEVALPRQNLSKNGMNVLQIQAGYYWASPNTLAYDSLSLDGLSLIY